MNTFASTYVCDPPNPPPWDLVVWAVSLGCYVVALYGIGLIP